MQKSMEPISVYIEEGKIVLHQDSFDPEEGAQKISLSPEQIPLLVSWLQDAAKEAEAQ